MSEPVIAGVISSGIFEGSKSAVGKIRSSIFDHPETIEEVEQTFNQSLQNEINERNEEIDEDSLDKLLKRWDSVVENLNGTEAVFAKEEEAVSHVTEILLDEINDLDNVHNVEQIIRASSAEAIETALDELEHQVKKNGMFEEFSTELDINILQQLNTIKNRLDTISQNSRYRQFYTIINTKTKMKKSEIKRKIADQLNADISPQYVPISKSQSVDQQGKHLIVGRRGAGKTRLLIETATDLLASGNIQQVIIPHQAFSASAALDSLLAETFYGESLLIWDDIHDISAIERSDPFRETILKLEEVISEKLSVIATARSEYYDDIPNIKRWQEDRLWSAFERIDLQSLSRVDIEKLIEGLQTEHTQFTESIERQLIEKVVEMDPTPFYAVSATRILQTKDSPSIEDVNDIPPTGVEIWKEQYKIIRDSNPEAHPILITVKLLHTLSVPLFPDLVRLTSEEVYNLEPLDFRPVIEDLVDRQWLETRNTEDNSKIFVIHGVQISAIEDFRWEHVEKFSTFTLNKLKKRVSFSNSFFAQLHHHIGLSARHKLEPQGAELAIDHFKKAFEFDPEFAEARSGYGALLANKGKHGDAIKHLIKASEMAPHHPAIRYNTGVILMKLGRREDAIPHLKKAAELKPDLPRVHSTLAMVLSREGKCSQAINKTQKAISLDSSLPHSYFVKAEAHYFEGDPAAALEAAKNAQSLLRDQDRYVNLIKVLQLSARAAVDDNQYDEAVNYCEEAFKLVEKIENNKTKMDFRVEDETIDILKVENAIRNTYLEALKNV